jgi:ribosomal protein S18 acetylase RimI-like enzyme
MDDLWVQPKYLSQNIRRTLLNNLGKTFKNKGYNNINLVTNGFQAAEFYKKCGFKQEFIRENK